MNPYDAGTDWHVSWWSDVDGDTVRILRWRDEQIADGLRGRFYDDPAWFPRGQSVRLINLDTPERGEDGWQQACDDLRAWLGAAGDALMVTTWGMAGGFDRLLGDFWVHDRNNTASQHMLRIGWDPYVEGV